jgi:hypothetical protein
MVSSELMFDETTNFSVPIERVSTDRGAEPYGELRTRVSPSLSTGLGKDTPDGGEKSGIPEKSLLLQPERETVGLSSSPIYNSINGDMTHISVTAAQGESGACFFDTEPLLSLKDT